LGGIVIDKKACYADIAYIEHAKLTSKQALDRVKDLQSLPPLQPIADMCELGDRFFILDELQQLHRKYTSAENLSRKADQETIKALKMIDWELAMSTCNQRFDRLVVALRLARCADRQKALREMEKELEALIKKSTWPADPFEPLLDDLPPREKIRKTTAQAIVEMSIKSTVGADRHMQCFHDQDVQVHRNLWIAFALAAYHADRGRYPAKLDDISPNYLASIPNDLFADAALIYRPSENGYLLYSVGENCKDEGGRGYPYSSGGDDLSVQMPQPLKPLK
jgi:hypothetical protein